MQHSGFCIKADNLKVGYEKKIIVDDIAFEVSSGEITTIIGPNGAGKSTILKTITKQLELMGGKITICDKDMQSMSFSDIAKKMSMVMTKRPHTELMTCFEVASTGRYPYTGRMGVLSKEDRDKVKEALRYTGALELADSDFNKISDGQKQRVMLARAICQDTDVIIMDEPVSFLDIKYKIDILDNIRDLARKKGIAIIMTLHELELARQISDKVICVGGGRVDKIGCVEEIFDGDYINRLYEIDERSFDSITCNMMLPLKEDSAQVFVIAGGMESVNVIYRLARQGRAFYAGIISENDVAFRTAKAMAKEVVVTKAYYPIEESHINAAKKLIDGCTYYLCAVDEFGPYNSANKELLQYAIDTGKKKL